MKSYRLADATCPYCGEKIDGASTPMGERRPIAGDLTICAYCAGLLVYDDLVIPRFPTNDEARIARADPRVALMRKAVMDRIGRRGDG